MEQVLYLGGLVCCLTACVAIARWTFTKDDLTLRVAKAGASAGLGLFAISTLLGWLV